MSLEKVSVIGIGAWGTTLAMLLAKKGYQVSVLTREEEPPEEIIKNGENKKYLSGIKLPPTIKFLLNPEEVLSNTKLVVIAIPTPFFRKVVTKIYHLFPPDAIIVNVAKGIDERSLSTMSGVLKEILPESLHGNIAVLSGPNLAREVAVELPAVTVVASEAVRVCRKLKSFFQTSYFRVFQSNDILGVEIGGALKNIFAIAAGIAEALEFGANTLSAIFNGGFTEIYSLGVAMGAKMETFLGPAGIGDLFTTCISKLSRNKTLGIELGKGRPLEDVLSTMNGIVEGVNTAKYAYILSQRYNLELPITKEVYKVIKGEVTPLEAVKTLMNQSYGETVYKLPEIKFNNK